MFKPPSIVAVCGPARCGKDTFAREFARLSGYRIHRFAETIKDTARLWFGWSEEQIEGELKEVVDERFGFSPREFFLKCGTEFARDMLDPDIWVKIFKSRFGTQCIVIPDCRFPNEADWVRRHHGILVHVQRANFTPNDFGGHESEKGIPHSIQDYVTLPCIDVDATRAAAVDFYTEFFEDLDPGE